MRKLTPFILQLFLSSALCTSTIQHDGTVYASKPLMKRSSRKSSNSKELSAEIQSTGHTQKIHLHSQSQGDLIGSRSTFLRQDRSNSVKEEEDETNRAAQAASKAEADRVAAEAAANPEEGLFAEATAATLEPNGEPCLNHHLMKGKDIEWKKRAFRGTGGLNLCIDYCAETNKEFFTWWAAKGNCACSNPPLTEDKDVPVSWGGIISGPTGYGDGKKCIPALATTSDPTTTTTTTTITTTTTTVTGPDGEALSPSTGPTGEPLCSNHHIMKGKDLKWEPKAYPNIDGFNGCMDHCVSEDKEIFTWWADGGTCACSNLPLTTDKDIPDMSFSGPTGYVDPDRDDPSWKGGDKKCFPALGDHTTTTSTSTTTTTTPTTTHTTTTITTTTTTVTGPDGEPMLPPTPALTPWCTTCNDTANAEMGAATCADWALTGKLYTKCRDGGDSWTSAKSCRWSCYEVGFGYGDDSCCAHHETPDSCDQSNNVAPSSGGSCAADATTASCASIGWKEGGFCECSCKKLRPHIIFMLIDDLGFDDFVAASDMQGAWSNTVGLMEETKTPNSAHGSVLVNSSYCEAVCAPTRSAFMLGRWRHLMKDSYGWGGVSWRDEIALALKMRMSGYKTYAIGKWHIGASHWRHLPAGRGFHRHYGQTENGDQYAHCSKNAHGGRRRKIVAFDVQVTETDPGYTKTGSAEAVCDACSPAAPHHEYDGSAVGKYSTEMYTEKAVDMLREHKRVYPRHPFFMYFAHYAIHSPYDAPQEDQSGMGSSDENAKHWAKVAYKNYYKECGEQYGILNDARRSICAMNTALDDSIKNLTDVLKDSYAGENYVVIVTGDNGGSTWYGGSSNAPLRGGKGEYWDGGIRHHVLVWGKHPDLKNVQSHMYTGGRMHLVDWHATIATLGQLGHRSLPVTNTMEVGHSSGHNVWNAITTNTESPAPYIVSADMPDRGMTWIEGDFKILIGGSKGRRDDKCKEGEDDKNGQPGQVNGRTKGLCLYGCLWPRPIVKFESDWRAAAYNDLDEGLAPIPEQLFNLRDDPGESSNLLTNCPDTAFSCAQYKQKYNHLKAKFNDLINTGKYRQSNGVVDFTLQNANCGGGCDNANCQTKGRSEFKRAFPDGMPAHGCEVTDTVHFPCYGMWPGY